ncbi:sensor histidine kinase [Cryptosporangium aurantiacum]|uniref:histidine kinase n=1 Tax=Cryptosporangium aurantiacum TaxID=134849 RepID=A0A1M7TX72_9ACTN|nr:HAMP domain-containing sensor histidine kinase [Cryptosporangium aurantiacum]SHN75203.1 Signal transduction histidine kinase [Cryptosporangium aurantiacum]
MTLRGQLTLLYSGAFVVCGAALLGVPLLQASESSPVPGQPGVPPGAGPSSDGVGVRQELVVSSLVGLALTVVVAVVLGWLIAGRLLRPLRTITATAREISASNLHRRLGVNRRDDEFRQLAAVLDDLFARLEASFEAQRRFVANASHELRTPLTAERTLLQVALADPDATADDLRAACREVLTLGTQQERLIDALLTLAGSESGIEHRRPLDVAEIVGGVLRGREGITGERRPAPTTGDPHLVESLVANLVDNAVRHNVDDGWVEVTTGTVEGRARLTVRNTGPEIPAEDVARLLEPFQQLGGARIRHGGGYGLGLPIVRAIADAHRATLDVRPREGGGLDVTVTF